MAACYHEGTVKGKGESDFTNGDQEKISERLRKAMKGLGTDEKVIIEALSSHTNTQLQTVKSTYKTLYGRDLEEDLRSELSGHFESLCIYRLTPSTEFDAKCLRKAMKGIGTKEVTLIEILCSHNNSEIKDIKEDYRKVYERDLEEDIKEETSGDFQRILVSLLQGNRDENQTVDQKQVEEDFKELKQAGTKLMFGTDESVFNKILAKRNLSHLKAVFEAYRSDEQKDIETVVADEMSGDLCKAFLAVVRFIKDPLEYFASCFYETMCGPGTDDERLMQLIVAHCEVDLKDIADKYMELYKKGLALAIEEDTYGDYRKLLLKLSGKD
ncbi:annexin A4 [Mytilus galloprovincialis]|uniref:Annexin n=1 Tax=Mytilus galloprovincialis TaxID=29158 RepID=A0A8B6HI17_MYTGA|nr:annexin A4 [Mytilus galloprovincialis]